MTTTLLHTLDHDGSPLLDSWLRFKAPIQTRYDEEHARRRVAELQSAILIGLALYNVYNITSVVLLADVLGLSVALRLCAVTATSLGLIWLIGRTSPAWTERLITGGILNAYLVPVYLFWATREPYGLFTFGELPLTIIFANMLLSLRFAHATLFTLGALTVTLLAVATKAGLDPALRFAFAVQIATACLFGLYANYRQEWRRCLDYLTALAATLAARDATADRQKFQDLSQTDALTRLPNRRYLTERLDAWLAEGRAVAVMMIDLDHFKPYNDALGHPAGDDCLRQVADVFARVAAEGADAFCARFGGEEFTFVMPGDSEIEAARRARALMRAIATLAIPHPARSDGLDIVSISVGVVRASAVAEHTTDSLMAAADRALYTAKRRGRNRFVFDEIPEQAIWFDR